MDAEQQAEALVHYYTRNRGAGHTRAVLDGAIEKNAIIVTSTAHFGHTLRERYSVPTVSLESLRGVLGRSEPLVLDNHATTTLLRGLAGRIDRLKAALNRIEREADEPAIRLVARQALDQPGGDDEG